MNSNVNPFKPRSPAVLPSRRYVLTVVYVSVGLVVGAFAVLAWLAGRSMVDVTDPAEYRATLARVGYPTPTAMDVPSLANFPPTLPSPAANPRFFYRPGFGQGEPLLQLRVHLPPDAIRQLVGQAQAIVLAAATRPTSRPTGDVWVDPGAAALFRNAANTDFEHDGLPADFRRFVYGSANNGDRLWSYGVAVSEERGEVIYWAEDR